MKLSEDDILNGVESYAAWKAVSGNLAGPYVTPAVEEQNNEKMALWAKDTLPGGLLGLGLMGGWQLAFNECLKAGLLVKDEAWHPNFRTPAQRKSLYKLLYASLSSRQLDAVYHGAFEKLDQASLLSEEQQRHLDLIGGPAGFKIEYEQSLGGK